MNPIKGEAPLILSDGREFTVILDFEALVEAETLYGKPLPVLMAHAASGFVGAVRAMLFGALRARHPDITAVETAEIVMLEMEAVGEALKAATENGFPSSEGKKSGNAPQAGKTSGRNGARQGSTRKASGGRPQRRSA